MPAYHYRAAPWRCASLLLTLVAAAAQAHECRLLGNATESEAASWTHTYMTCVGFRYEDANAGQPGQGKANNLDFLPVYNVDYDRGRLLNVERTRNNAYPDIVDIKATVYWLNGKVFPSGQPFNILGVGHESPIALNAKGNPRWKHTITEWKQGISEGMPTYGDVKDFVLPFKGMYAWVIEGKLRAGRRPPVYFVQKYTCQQPLWEDRTAEPSYFDCARW